MTPRLVERIILGILLVIAAGMTIHTPLTLWLGLQWPEADMYIKAWKELLMGCALLLIVVVGMQRQQLGRLMGDRLLQLCLAYAVLHGVMAMVFHTGWEAVGAGLLIDLRYVLYFVLVYVFLQLFPTYRRLLITVLLGGAVIIIGFAVLQALVLPRDILATIGYSKATIAPFLTVDENPAFIRVNSTLRGPNPLGAYAVMVIGLLLAVAFRWRLQVRGQWLVVGAAVATGIALGATHSRSSMIAAVVAVVVVTLIAVSAVLRKRLLILFTVVLVVASGMIVVFRDNYFVANVILHNNPATGAAIDSNAAHADSLEYGLDRMIHQPFGAGVGSSGSASLLGDKPLIIENQYLLVAHEVGWIGLLLFGWLYVEVLRRLWYRRKSALALGVFGSGIGLAIIGVLLPVWVDDTVSIIWWGLAAVAAAAPIVTTSNTKAKTKVRKRHDGRKSN